MNYYSVSPTLLFSSYFNRISSFYITFCTFVSVYQQGSFVYWNKIAFIQYTDHDQVVDKSALKNIYICRVNRRTHTRSVVIGNTICMEKKCQSILSTAKKVGRFSPLQRVQVVQNSRYCLPRGIACTSNGTSNTATCTSTAGKSK